MRVLCHLICEALATAECSDVFSGDHGLVVVETETVSKTLEVLIMLTQLIVRVDFITCF
jgi:hypothetical protein